MQNNFSTSIVVNATPQQAFDAINNVPAWWCDNVQGNSTTVGDEFETRFGDVHYSKQKVTELIPTKKVVWLVTNSNLSFLEDTDEWNGTEIVFDIVEEGGKTKITLTHVGLVPEIECYNACSPAWAAYLKFSLYSLLTQGKGQPGFPPNKAL